LTFGNASNDDAYRQVVFVDHDVVIPIELILFVGFLFAVIAVTMTVIVLAIRRQRRRLRLATQKLHDVVSQLFAGVLLQEVSGAANQWVIDTLRAAHLTLEDLAHRPGDRVAVAEGNQDGGRAHGQLRPCRLVGR
jgi:hypothetical protein